MAEPAHHPSGNAARPGVREVVHGRPVPDVLLELDAAFADVVGMLDGQAAARRMVSHIPALVGVDMAWIGEPTGADRMELQHAVNSTSGLIEGLVVPVGTGLGGKVLAAGRPLWVSDYCAAPDISHHFKTQVRAEGIKAMIAVPVVADRQMLGVLYAANRRDTAFGDLVTQALEQMASRTAAAQVVAERARHAAEVAVHEERRRMALELHDTVGAMLFTLGAGIQRLGAEPGLDAEVRVRLSRIEQQASEAAAALRGSLHVLNAPPEQVALGVAVREHCRAFQARTGVPASVITLTELPVLPDARIAALADAVREALLNVEKHARARSVVVSVFATRDGVAVTVSDDGAGLRPSGATSGTDATGAGRGGLGLAAVTDQLARLGGRLSVATNDDRGVTLRAWLPA